MSIFRILLLAVLAVGSASVLGFSQNASADGFNSFILNPGRVKVSYSCGAVVCESMVKIDNLDVIHEHHGSQGPMIAINEINRMLLSAQEGRRKVWLTLSELQKMIKANSNDSSHAIGVAEDPGATARDSSNCAK